MEEETLRKMIHRRVMGASIRAIASELELSKTTVLKYLHMFRDDVEIGLFLEKEEVLEEYKAGEIERTRVLAKSFRDLSNAIEGADWTSADTLKLVPVWFQMTDRLQKEGKVPFAAKML